MVLRSFGFAVFLVVLSRSLSAGETVTGGSGNGQAANNVVAAGFRNQDRSGVGSTGRTSLHFAPVADGPDPAGRDTTTRSLVLQAPLPPSTDEGSELLPVWRTRQAVAALDVTSQPLYPVLREDRRFSFRRMPQVVRVPKSNFEEEADAEGGMTDFLDLAENTRIFDFDAPAFFPLPLFKAPDPTVVDPFVPTLAETPTGPEPCVRGGTVIHEGMRLVLSPDGLYELRFVASTPAMPVTLRLQLVLFDGINRYTLTPPLIVLPPHRTTRGDYEAASWRVRHVGYSSVLTSPRLKKVLVFPPARIGTARYGSYPTAPGSPGH